MNKKLLIFAVILLLVFVLVFALLFFQGVKQCSRKPCVKIGKNVFYVTMADTIEKRTEGLSKKDNLAQDEGMLFLFDKESNYGFWMKGVKFPIDIIWIKDNKVVDLSENIQPEVGKPDSELKIYNPHEPVNKVLELKAGTVKKYGFRSGDSVEVSL